MRRSISFCSKRISPPSDSISARIFSTMLTRRNVPICGLATYRISSGAPALTNSVSTLRVRWRGSLIWLHSLPSEKGSRPALAELHVRLGIEHALAPQPPGVLRALAHALAALQHDRSQPHLRQHQRREDAAWSEADDDRPRTLRRVEIDRRVPDEAVTRVRRSASGVDRPSEPAARPLHRERRSRSCRPAPWPISFVHRQPGGTRSWISVPHRARRGV